MFTKIARDEEKNSDTFLQYKKILKLKDICQYNISGE